MTKDKKENIKKTVRILMQLDEKSLLLIDSGAKLLAAYQNMNREDVDSSSQSAADVLLARNNLERNKAETEETSGERELVHQ